MQTVIERIPKNKIKKLVNYVNTEGKTLEQIYREEQPYLAMNSWYFGSPQGAVCHVKSDGVVYENDAYQAYGLLWDVGPDLHAGFIDGLVFNDGNTSTQNHGSATLLVRDGKRVSEIYVDSSASRPAENTAIALAGDDVIFYATEESVTPEMLADYFPMLGADFAMKLDGGGSTQIITPTKHIHSDRIVEYLLLVYLVDEELDDSEEVKEKQPGKNGYMVFGDPGHGPGNPNCSPDGSYFEYEGVWGIWEYLDEALIRCGFETACGRTEDYRPAYLSEVTNKANASGADVFVSIHTNAANSTGQWSSASGFLVYTSSGPDTANRNKLAFDILSNVEEAGVKLFGEELYHSSLYVLTNTTMPAVLAECGFHTNEEDTALLLQESYRKLLAEAMCKGICEYFEVSYVASKQADLITDEELWELYKDKIPAALKQGSNVTIDSLLRILYNLEV